MSEFIDGMEGIGEGKQGPAERKSWILEQLERVKGSSEKDLLAYLNNYADMVATRIKDVKHSAHIRSILENPQSKKKEYDLLLASAKLHILHGLFDDLSKKLFEASNGAIMVALGRIPEYKPVIFVPDNEFGNYVMDSLEEVHVQLGISEPFGNRTRMAVDEKTGALKKSGGNIIQP